jgi:hypothetical protein
VLTVINIVHSFLELGIFPKYILALIFQVCACVCPCVCAYVCVCVCGVYIRAYLKSINKKRDCRE